VIIAAITSCTNFTSNPRNMICVRGLCRAATRTSGGPDPQALGEVLAGTGLHKTVKIATWKKADLLGRAGNPASACSRFRLHPPVMA